MKKNKKKSLHVFRKIYQREKKNNVFDSLVIPRVIIVA